MGFIKLERVIRNKVSFPAIHIGKGGQAFMNTAFTRELGLEKMDKKGEPTIVSFNVYYDKDTNRIGIKLEREGDIKRPVHSNGQVLFYVKTLLNGIGKHGYSGIFPVSYDKEVEMWTATLKKSQIIEEDDVKKESKDKIKEIHKKLKDKHHKKIERI